MTLVPTYGVWVKESDAALFEVAELTFRFHDENSSFEIMVETSDPIQTHIKSTAKKLRDDVGQDSEAQ